MFSPMEQFTINSFISFPILVTSFSFYFFIVTMLIFAINLYGKYELVGSSYTIFNESIFATILNMIETYIGKNAAIY